MKWVKLRKYCELSGDTIEAVKTRRHRGIWQDGIQSRLGPDGKLWVNLEEVEKWVEQGMKVAQHHIYQSKAKGSNNEK